MSNQPETAIAQPPLSVAIETTRLCNLKCIMCPIHGPDANHNLADNPPYMSTSRYTNMLGQIKDFAPLAHICPQLQGEPLLDDRILGMIKLARFMDFTTGFVTNGTLLNQHISEQLVELGVYDIGLSINGATKKTAEQVMIGSNFEETVNNMEYLLKIRNKKMDISINVVKQPANEHEISQIVGMWIDKVDRVKVNYPMWQGEQSWNFKVGREPCRYLWNGFNILTNGDITPCCVVPNSTVLGNAFTTPLEEIWNGKEYQQIRGLHLTGRWDEHPFCSKCDTWAMGCLETRTETHGILVKQIHPLFTTFKHIKKPSPFSIARNLTALGIRRILVQ